MNGTTLHRHYRTRDGHGTRESTPTATSIPRGGGGDGQGRLGRNGGSKPDSRSSSG